MEIDSKIISQTSGKNHWAVKQVNYRYWSDVSFMEKLLFLFGKKKIYIDNKMEFQANGSMNISNHVKFLNIDA